MAGPGLAEVRAALRVYLRALARGGSLRIFAALQRNCTYWGAGFAGTRNNMGTTGTGKSHNYEVVNIVSSVTCMLSHLA